MFARLSRIGEYAYIVQEYLIMKYLVSQDGPGPVFKYLIHLLHGCGQDRRAKILTGVKRRCVERPSAFPA